MYTYVCKKTVSPARKICMEVLNSVKERLQSEGIKVQIEPVGSAKENLVTRNGNEPFDLDFNILVLHSDLKLDILKNTVMAAVKGAATVYGFQKVEDSTSAITCKHYPGGTNKIDFRMDLGIIVMKDSSSGNRLIHDKKKGVYIQNRPVQYRNLKERKAAIRQRQKTSELRQVYLEKKNFYLKKGDRNHPSFVVYVEAVNQVYQKILNDK